MLGLLRQTMAVVGLGATLAGATTAAQAAEQLRQVYDVSVSGVRVGVLEMAANVENGAYAATGSITSRGIAGVLFPFTLSGTSAGRIKGQGQLEPVRYSGTQKDDNRRDVSIRYTRGTPTFVEWVPQRKVRKHDVAFANQRGTLDPISASYAVLMPLPADKACGRTLEIYDGSKRSRIIVGQPQTSGAQVVCSGVYRRVAGFSPKQMSEKVDFPFTVTYDAVDGMLTVNSIQLDSVIGRAVMRRR